MSLPDKRATHDARMPATLPYAESELRDVEKVALLLAKSSPLAAVLGLQLNSPTRVVGKFGDSNWRIIISGADGDVVLDYRETNMMENCLHEQRLQMLRLGRTPPIAGPYFFYEDGSRVTTQSIFAAIEIGIRHGRERAEFLGLRI